MYGIFTNIGPINHPNVGKYTSTMDHLGKVCYIPRKPFKETSPHDQCPQELVMCSGKPTILRRASDLRCLG